MILEVWNERLPAMTTTISPRTLSPHVAYALAAAIIGLALFASGTPSPLYGTYSELWGFSPIVLTLVYATYAFGVLTTLILAGRVSDEVGRRPVLLVALGTLHGRDGPVHARRLGRLAVRRPRPAGPRDRPGARRRAAALLDLHPRRDVAGVGLANGVASAAGMGLGVLVSAALVELLPAPRVLPYVLLFVLFAVALAGTLRLPEPVAERSRMRLTPQRPSVPPVVRRPFFLAALGVHLLVVDRRACSCRSARSSRPRCSTPPTTSWPVSPCSCWPAPPPSRSSCSAARRRGLGAALGSIALAIGPAR